MDNQYPQYPAQATQVIAPSSLVPAGTLGLEARLSAAMKDLSKQRLEKRGHLAFGNTEYDYLTAADVQSAVAKALATHGVALTVTEERIEWLKKPEGPQSPMSVVLVTLALIFRADGQSIRINSTGEGRDIGDKAIYKAKTGAMKYALVDTFLLAAGDDPEQTSGVEGADQGRATLRARKVRAVTDATPTASPPAASTEAVTYTYISRADLAFLKDFIGQAAEPENTQIAILKLAGVSRLDQIPADKAIGILQTARRHLAKKSQT